MATQHQAVSGCPTSILFTFLLESQMEAIATRTAPAMAFTAIANAVVQNDKSSSQSAEVHMFGPLAALEERRVTWETTVYRTSNQQLYALLADCYRYGQKPSTVEEAKERSAHLREFAESRGYRLKPEAPLLTRIVKVVFGNLDRRRICTYSIVLRAAAAQGIPADDLANWIEREGGIQEIRLGRSKTYVSAETKITTAEKSLKKSTALAVAKSDALSKLADADCMGETCLLIAEQQADGGFAIKAVVRAKSAVNAAWSAVYSQSQKVV